MEDFEIPDYEQEEDEYLSDSEKQRKYDIGYLTELKVHTDPFDSYDRDETIKKLETLKYTPSNNPKNDAHLNFMIAREAIRQESKLDPNTRSYLQEIAKRDGKTMAEVTREYRKLIKE